MSMRIGAPLKASIRVRVPAESTLILVAPWRLNSLSPRSRYWISSLRSPIPSLPFAHRVFFTRAGCSNVLSSTPRSVRYGVLFHSSRTCHCSTINCLWHESFALSEGVPPSPRGPRLHHGVRIGQQIRRGFGAVIPRLLVDTDHLFRL